LTPRPRRGLVAALALAPALSLASCKDVASYSTGPDESYCGSVIQGPFVRKGLGPAVQMRLKFNAEALDSTPGILTTSDGLLIDAALRPIPQLFNDPLSTLQFGEGRRRNLIYVVSPARPGPPLLVVLSLMESGGAEVRLLRGDPASDGSTTDAAIFGVFPLQRSKGVCGL